MKVTRTGIAKTIFDLMHDHEPPMTTKELSEKSGVGKSKLDMILSDSRDKTGNKRLPNSDDILSLAEALDVSPYKLLTGNDDENHVVCEELGLSNESINHLKLCSNKLISGLMGYSSVPKMIDMLLQDSEFRFLRLLYSYIVSEFSTVPHIKEQTIKYKKTERGFERVPDDYVGEVTEEREKVLDPIPMSEFPDLTKEVIEKGAAMRIMDYAQQLRDEYQKKQAKSAACSE